jgi:hypothetical protein
VDLVLRAGRCAMTVPDVDDSEWPIVIVRFSEFTTLDEIPVFAGLLDQVFAKRGPMVTITDTSKIDAPGMTKVHRKMLALEIDKLRDKGAIVGTATIIRTPAVLRLYQSYLWLRNSTSYPMEIFYEEEKAKGWARSILSGQALQ